MARNLNNPETPREGLEETRRDLNELRAEVSQGPIDVAFGPIIGSIAATQILESLNWSEETEVVEEENLDLDEEVKSWMEKIVNKSFEDVISDYKGDFPMWFERMNIIEKLNAISLKAAINKLWKNAKNLPINKIKEEALNQKKLFINKANEKLSNSIKSKNDLKSYWLTDSECNKIVKLLENMWLIRTSETNDDWDRFYGKNWVLIWEDEEGREYTWRRAEAIPALLPFIGWPVLLPIMNLLVRAWIVKKQWKQEKPKEDNDQNPKEKGNENKPENWDEWKSGRTRWWNSWWAWQWWAGGGWESR